MNHKKLPEEFLQICEAIRQSNTTSDWTTARMLDDFEQESGEQLPRGQVADALGCVPSVVSYLVLTAKRISPELQEQYDGLAFSCFRFAAIDPNPADVLRIAVESADDYGGKPGGVRVVRAIVRERKGGDAGKDKPRTWSGHITRIENSFYALLDITDNRVPLVGSAGTWRETP